MYIINVTILLLGNNAALVWTHITLGIMPYYVNFHLKVMG
jgi:hypothetical protein